MVNEKKKINIYLVAQLVKYTFSFFGLRMKPIVKLYTTAMSCGKNLTVSLYIEWNIQHRIASVNVLGLYSMYTIDIDI